MLKNINKMWQESSKLETVATQISPENIPRGAPPKNDAFTQTSNSQAEAKTSSQHHEKGGSTNDIYNSFALLAKSVVNLHSIIDKER